MVADPRLESISQKTVVVLSVVIINLENNYDPNLKSHNNDEGANLESDEPRATGTR